MVDERIDESNINDWNVKSLNEYEGVYFFGYSESESQMTLSIDDKLICVQLQSYEWVESENKELEGWHSKYVNYSKIKIVGNKFFSEESNGEFVLYNNKKFLKLENSPYQLGKEGEYELGIYVDDKLSKYYGGRFLETVFAIVKVDYLNSLSLEDLQIMRNEVFARYGYIFKSEGKMDTYFKKKKWYRGINKKVDEFLSEIERINISAIQKVEQEKRKNK